MSSEAELILNIQSITIIRDSLVMAYDKWLYFFSCYPLCSVSMPSRLFICSNRSVNRCDRIDRSKSDLIPWK